MDKFNNFIEKNYASQNQILSKFEGILNYKIFIMRMKMRKKGLHENLVMLISPYKR